ncbi:MAG: hypothetical protein H6729_03855 [Deltaproteobacteria bacterium]|nr:hypothetical protein [Deltaproteobacteria bacterium]
MKSWFRNTSVLAKILMANAAVVVPSMVVHFIQLQNVQAALKEKAEAMARLVAHTVAPALDFGDPESVQEIFRGAAQDPDFRFAILFAESGTVIAASGETNPSKWRPVDNYDRLASDYTGNVLRVVSPVLAKGGGKGVLVLGLSAASLVARGSSAQQMALVSVVVMLLLGFMLAFAVARHINRRLEAMALLTKRVAAGDLAPRLVHDESADAIGRSAAHLDQMIEAQRSLVHQIAETVVELNASAEEFFATAQHQETGATEQSASIEEITRTMDGLSNSARAITKSTDRLSGLAEEISKTRTTSQEALEASREAMGQIVAQNTIIGDRIHRLYESSQAIISVVDIIEDISDRLDLLALNAALEGARAGEVGKGFALVAQEMRRLAENVTGSTSQIKATVQEIQQYIQATSEAGQQGSRRIEQGAEQTERMSSAIRQMFEFIQESSQSTKLITHSTQQQLSATEQVVRSMKEVATVSNEGATLAQQLSQSANSISGIALRLRTQISVFNLKPTENPGATGASVR